MAFDAFNGDVHDLDFIPYHESLVIPTAVEKGPVGIVLVSELAANAVYQFDYLTGEYLGVFAPWSGIDTDIVHSPFGMFKFKSPDPDSPNLLVVSGGSTGTNTFSVVEFNGSGTYVGARVAPGAGGLDKPRGIIKRDDPFNDLLVTSMDTGVVHRFDLAGNPLSDFAVIEGGGRLEQIHVVPATGDVLVVVNTSAPKGIHRFTSDGTFVATLAPPGIDKYKGVASLGNGNLLVTTNRDGVFEMDYDGNLIETMTDTHAGYPKLINITTPGEIFRDGFESGTLEEWTVSGP